MAAISCARMPTRGLLAIAACLGCCGEADAFHTAARPLLRRAQLARSAVHVAAAAAYEAPGESALLPSVAVDVPAAQPDAGAPVRASRPRRPLGERLRSRYFSLALVRICFAPAAAAATAGLTSLGFSPPRWARAVITLALMVGASRLASTSPALAVRAHASSALAGARDKFVRKWRLNWKSYITIPFVAAATGWLTNYIAVKMIFYPLDFVGIPLCVQDGTPLGLLGWRGIVPAKTGAMAHRMVDTLTKLIDVRAVFGRLDPAQCASLLMPGVAAMVPDIISSLVPGSIGWAKKGAVGVANSVFAGLPGDTQKLLQARTSDFIGGTVKAMQGQIDGMLDLRGLVVGEMLRDRSLLGELFQKVGRCELAFLVDSGIYFGFGLGILQMCAWVLYDKPWTLALGGAIVGFVLVLSISTLYDKPWTLASGIINLYPEVSEEFAATLTPATLTSEKLFGNIISGQHGHKFDTVLRERTANGQNGYKFDTLRTAKFVVFLEIIL
ncbi:hypothetical protein T492DRAFT_845125 [Pavlovales sp. CCMP2436]|nr:hypothetical protein T492DRAFT_845125 [Pavlovales sp. CCMP2436]